MWTYSAACCAPPTKPLLVLHPPSTPSTARTGWYRRASPQVAVTYDQKRNKREPAGLFREHVRAFCIGNSEGLRCALLVPSGAPPLPVQSFAASAAEMDGAAAASRLLDSLCNGIVRAARVQQPRLACWNEARAGRAGRCVIDDGAWRPVETSAEAAPIARALCGQLCVHAQRSPSRSWAPRAHPGTRSGEAGRPGRAPRGAALMPAAPE